MLGLPVVFWVLLSVSAIISGAIIWIMVTNKPLSPEFNEIAEALVFIEAILGIVGIFVVAFFTIIKAISPWWFTIPVILLIPAILVIVSVNTVPQGD